MRLRHLFFVPALTSLIACGGGDDTTAAPEGIGTGGTSSGGKGGAAGKAGSGTGGTTAGAGGSTAGSGGSAAGTSGASGKGGSTGGKGGSAGAAGSGGTTGGSGGSMGGASGKGGASGAAGSAGATGGKGGTGGSAGSGGSVGGSAGASGKGGSAGTGGTAGAGGTGGTGGATGGSSGSGGAVGGSAGTGGSVGGSAGTGGGGSSGGFCVGKPDATPCDDGSACTTGEACLAGACTGGTTKTCAASDQCHDVGTCDPANGMCSNPAKADSTPCSDGSMCTQTDTCKAGVCVGGNPVVCPADQCHLPGTCAAATGMCSAAQVKPNLTPCDDGNPCTVGDWCIAGACAGTAKACPWTDACHDGVCNAATGACETAAVADGSACSDGSVCTSGDKCTAGVCGGNAVCTGTTVVISEFRVRGSGGAGDEMIEIYNTTAAPIDISGWKIKSSNNAGTIGVRATVPAMTSLPAFGHYLITNTGYSEVPNVTGNLTYGTGIADDGGIAITLANDTIVDQVGMSAGSAFKEGTILTPLAPNSDLCYERRPGSGHGSPIDTGNNAADFFASTGCDPQNLASELTPAFSHAPKVLFFAGLNAAPVQATTTITNTLVGALTIQSAAVGGANASEFTFLFASALPHMMAAAGTLDVTVTHTPTASGLRTATLLVTTSGGETQAIDLVAGDAPLARAEATPPVENRRRATGNRQQENIGWRLVSRASAIARCLLPVPRLLFRLRSPGPRPRLPCRRLGASDHHATLR